jgi:hypothetical protein
MRHPQLAIRLLRSFVQFALWLMAFCGIYTQLLGGGMRIARPNPR